MPRAYAPIPACVDPLNSGGYRLLLLGLDATRRTVADHGATPSIQPIATAQTGKTAPE
jgi:hypothetical protein